MLVWPGGRGGRLASTCLVKSTIRSYRLGRTHKPVLDTQDADLDAVLAVEPAAVPFML